MPLKISLAFFLHAPKLMLLRKAFCLKRSRKGSPTGLGQTRQEGEVRMKAMWSVVILFEDAQTRVKAVKFCDQLVERFWTHCEFRLTWMEFSALDDPNAARDAHAKAHAADVIVFATRPEGPVPAAVTNWVERSLANRTDREGTLAGLIDTSTILTGWAAEKHAWLRSVAHRAGMDYLTDVPPEITRPIPDSLESFSERAQQITSVLDEILRKPIHPPSLP